MSPAERANKRPTHTKSFSNGSARFRPTPSQRKAIAKSPRTEKKLQRMHTLRMRYDAVAAALKSTLLELARRSECDLKNEENSKEGGVATTLLDQLHAALQARRNEKLRLLEVQKMYKIGQKDLLRNQQMWSLECEYRVSCRVILKRSKD